MPLGAFGCVKGFLRMVLLFLFLLPFAASVTIYPRTVFILHLILLLYQQDPFAALFFQCQKTLDSFPRSPTSFLSSGGIKTSVGQAEVLQSILSKNDVSFLNLKFSISVLSYAKPLHTIIQETANSHFRKT